MADTHPWASYDFLASQGSRWRRFIRFWQDDAKTLAFDFTGCVVNMHIREGVFNSGATLKAELSSVANSDAPQRIFFPPADSNGLPIPEGAEDRASGFLMLLLEDEDTAAIVPTKLPKRGTYPANGNFFYDIEVTDSLGITLRRMAGKWTLSLEVTRDE